MKLPVLDSPAFELRGVSFAYDADRSVLRDVTLSIPRRDFVSVIGPNGGGKTTLLRLLLGLLTPDSGEVRVLGADPVEARPRVGYMPQSVNLDPQFPVTVLDVVLMGRLAPRRSFGRYSRADRAASMEALDRVGLRDVSRRPYSALSGGQRQRVLIARALASQPEILLLDEPTANLDIRVQDEFYALLRELNRTMTVLLVSHDVGLVSQLVRTIVCVEGHGQVEVHCSTDLSGEMIRNMYGMDVKLVRHDLHHHHHGHHHGDHHHHDHDHGGN